MTNPISYTHVFSDKEFIKLYKKADVRLKKSIDEKLKVFVKNPFEAGLDNHPLRDEWEGHRSIDITTDYRAIYKEVKEGEELNAYFVALGTHKELYRKPSSEKQ
jgi:addiction module RelE/StbE family toxin